MRKCKAPKVNIAAIQEAVFRINDHSKAFFNGANGIDIKCDTYAIDIDELLSYSFRLYGIHNRLSINVEEGRIALHGASYYLLPEFLIEGEEVEFEIQD